MRARLAMVSALLAVGVALVSAQVNQLSGTVRDASGNALPGVTVLLKGPALDKIRTTTTDARGKYTFKDLPADDDYTVAFSLVSFCPVVRGNVKIADDQEATTDAVMRFEVCRDPNPSGQSRGGIVLLSAH